MLYEVAIKIILLQFLLSVEFFTCHLKDMGEISKNWTNILIHLEKRIIGGSKTTKNEYPHAVQFFNFGGLCGGSILTRKIILTAAHCFDHNKNIAEMKIFSNPRFLFDLQSIMHEVWHYEIHQDYGRDSVFSNDIAILMIHDSFEFGPGVQKAKIIDTEVWMTLNNTFMATGWGETKYGEGLKENDFKKTDLYYVTRERCMYENQINLGPEMFCLHGNGERDTCRGDSGGGVLWRGAIVGIISHGRGCAQTPGIYVNVYYYRVWIKDTVENIYGKFCNFHDNKVNI